MSKIERAFVLLLIKPMDGLDQRFPRAELSIGLDHCWLSRWLRAKMYARL